MLAYEGPLAETNYSRQKAKEMAKKFIPGELCSVCGDVASGIHYSVAACNGCKTFFRRVVLENRTYSCKNNGDCIIDKSMRCSCRHCRYKKCIIAGMDRGELSMERRRKRKKLNGLEGSEESWETEDALINLLLYKETLYQKLLLSSAMMIHTSLREALDMTQIAFNDENHTYDERMDPKYPTNFSYWRAKILTVLVEWAKSFEVFSHLIPEDQKRLFIHTAFSNLVLAEAFHTPEKYNDRIVFPDGLCGFRNVAQSVSTDGVSNKTFGLTPTVVAVINDVLVPIRRMRLTKVEYVLLQAIIFFDPDCLSLTKHGSQLIAAKRKRLLDSLQKWLHQQTKDSIEASTRFAEILLRICNVQKVAAFKRETLCTIETFELMQPHPFTMEISKSYPDFSYF
ncbi:Nuclear Hormone Receptor family [Caenorhabditis elegans]|uniref:Nuclear Hormone Receptor family n=1 Tax=Caenorhabditis elegans TaxID=6239 RepID=Q17589_CAEEL|nr:Nuclear Hormone Receptor family [Caenorhabditis elegans]CAA90291.1 Nuclear Hormone Receptor family [Caenorhabditis elegans]|eukprot:NP_510115.1 Nuclear Hormone Receptor family [Caenorhabditis elegans]